MAFKDKGVHTQQPQSQPKEDPESVRKKEGERQKISRPSRSLGDFAGSFFAFAQSVCSCLCGFYNHLRLVFG